jgi:purine-binding chemotaxis protein CheW
MEPAAQREEILVFVLAGQRYALWVSDVRELLRAVAIVPLPQAPGIIEGVINLRGRVVPVIDLRRRFGLPARDVQPNDHLIVVAAGARLVAVRADRALDLVRLDPRQIERGAALSPAARQVPGVARLAYGLTVIHDVRAFLSDAEATGLDEALAAEAHA